MSYFEIGILKAKRGDYKGAIADFNKGIKLEPQDERLYLAKGYFKTELERNSELNAGHGNRFELDFKNKSRD